MCVCAFGSHCHCQCKGEEEGRKRGRVGWRCVLQEDVAHLNLPMELTNPWVLRNFLNYEPFFQNICKWEYSWQRAFNLKLQKMRNHFIYCENRTKVECCFRRILHVSEFSHKCSWLVRCRKVYCAVLYCL